MNIDKEKMTVGELKKLLENVDDNKIVMVTAENAYNEALLLQPYSYETSIDQNVFLLTQGIGESVEYSDL